MKLMNDEDVCDGKLRFFVEFFESSRILLRFRNTKIRILP